MTHNHTQNVQGELCCSQHKTLAISKNTRMFASKCTKIASV